jgi:hypothetical protein
MLHAKKASSVTIQELITTEETRHDYQRLLHQLLLFQQELLAYIGNVERMFYSVR